MDSIINKYANLTLVSKIANLTDPLPCAMNKTHGEKQAYGEAALPRGPCAVALAHGEAYIFAVCRIQRTW